jgi:uncharacterized protein (TIGR02145 family)
MKNSFIIFLTIISFSALAQTKQNINKNTDTISNAINTIDSIRFNGSSTTMEVVLQNGTLESHSISEIINVNFNSASQHSCGADSVHNSNITYGSMTDQEGNVYKTIVIGDQEWMAENLKTSIYRNGEAIDNVTDSIQWPNLTTAAYCFYNNDSQYECPYGKIYNWYAVADQRNVCPAGWHVPSDVEWSNLINYLDPIADGGNNLSNVAGGSLKSAGLQYWIVPNQDATNESGFSGLPAGGRDGAGGFDPNFGGWWSSSQFGAFFAYTRSLFYGFGYAYRNSYGKQHGFSVRCLTDESTTGSTLPIITTNAISNITGNSAIGGGNITSDGGAPVTQRGICWSTSPNPTTSENSSIDGIGSGSFISNLTSLTSNTIYYVRAYAINSVGTAYGNQITFITLTTSISSQHTCGATNVHNTNLNYGSMTDQEGNVYKTIVIGTQEWMAENLKTSTYRNGDPINYASSGEPWALLTTGAWCYFLSNSQYNCPYGKLYNWYAVADPRNVCPTGWHVPTDAEWTTLINFLGGESVAGGKMKSTGTQYWLSPNASATNESGFSGLPGGNRDGGGGQWGFLTGVGYWWSSTQSSSTTNAWSRKLNNGSGSATRPDLFKQEGFSVRCLKD